MRQPNSNTCEHAQKYRRALSWGTAHTIRKTHSFVIIGEMQDDQLQFTGLHELRAHLAEAVNRAAYGHQPTVVLRRRTKLAAVISFDDLLFLERMKQRRAEAMSEEPPRDPAQVGAYLARKLEAEMRYG